MIRQSEAARVAALFLSFAAFFLSCPLGLWDSCLFAQISFDRALGAAVVDGLCVAAIMAALALGLWAMARGMTHAARPLGLAGPVLYAIGLCLYVMLQGLGAPVGKFGGLLLGACIGSGLAIVIVSWCRMMARFGLRRSLVGLGISCGAATLAGFGFEVGVLPQPLGAFAFFALLGVAAPLASAARKSDEPEMRASDDVPAEHLWASMRTMVFNPCLGLCLFLFVMTAREFVFMGYEHIGGISVLAASVLAVVLARFWPGFSLATIYRLLLPVAAALFIVLSSFPVGTMSFSLGFLVSHGVMATVALLALASLAAVARAGEFSPVVVGAALCAMTSLAVLVGSNLSRIAPQDDSMGSVLLVCAMAYFVYVLISPLADYYRMFREADGAGTCGEAAFRDVAQPLDYERVCAALADERNLSAREREILPYIARGHRPAYVADLLCISEHTVRTHLRNMYRKLGVNSREGLIQLVEEAAIG